MHAAAEAETIAVLDFPQDLGATRRGIPASMWQREDLITLTEVGCVRGAIYLKGWVAQGMLNPTGLLSNSRLLKDDPEFHTGWLAFDEKHRYLGPLSPRGHYDLARDQQSQPNVHYCA